LALAAECVAHPTVWAVTTASELRRSAHLQHWVVMVALLLARFAQVEVVAHGALEASSTNWSDSARVALHVVMNSFG
jgi:hypothetical protein